MKENSKSNSVRGVLSSLLKEGDTFIRLNIHITIHGNKNNNNYGRCV